MICDNFLEFLYNVIHVGILAVRGDNNDALNKKSGRLFGGRTAQRE